MSDVTPKEKKKESNVRPNVMPTHDVGMRLGLNGRPTSTNGSSNSTSTSSSTNVSTTQEPHVNNIIGNGENPIVKSASPTGGPSAVQTKTHITNSNTTRTRSNSTNVRHASFAEPVSTLAELAFSSRPNVTRPSSTSSSATTNVSEDVDDTDSSKISSLNVSGSSLALTSQSATTSNSAPHTPEVGISSETGFYRSISLDGETQLNQAAIKLLQRLEFKNPGRKQMEYGTFNPEESEREKKKLRRFQTFKPRVGVCYKEDGTLLDGRDICDCLGESCSGCFYSCPQCTSKKCGPTCRSNRKWVYDYIEDEGRSYRVEFPDMFNFGT